MNYNGGPEIKILSDKAYIPSSLAPIIENNEINHNDKLNEENKVNNNNINKTVNKLSNTYDYKKNEKKLKQKKKKQIDTFEHERKILNYENNEKEMEQHSSNMESNEFDEEYSKNISVDTPSNKINSLNVYTFNTKFCDFNNKKSRRTGKFKEFGFTKKNKRFMN